MAYRTVGAVIAADAGLPEAMTAAMIAHAEQAAPREACGLVAYDAGGQPIRLYPLTNVETHPRRFEIDPAEHYRTILHAEAEGWKIGAVYHSHPYGPSKLSRTDLEAGIDREWISFIVSRRGRRWRVLPFSIMDGASVRLVG